MNQVHAVLQFRFVQWFGMLLAACLVLGQQSVHAGIKSELAQEATEWVVRKFGKEAVEEGTEQFAKKLEQLAVRHGDEVFDAVRRVGPKAMKVVASAGDEGIVAARVLSRFGDEGLWVAQDAARLKLFSRFGDDAAEAMIRHKGIAQPLVQAFEQPAAKALRALNGQNARRLGMLADEGSLAKLGRTSELLDVVARYGDRAMDFVWRNKGALAIGATMAAFLANPEPFLDGTRQLAEVVTEEVASPLTKGIASTANWTWLGLMLIGTIGVYACFRSLLKRVLA